MKSIIKGRWEVEGYYVYNEKIRDWVFLCSYYSGDKVMWEFEDYTVTCICDEKKKFTLPYSVVRENILLIDFSDDFHHYIGHYELRLTDDILWLRQMDSDTQVAIKMRMR